MWFIKLIQKSEGIHTYAKECLIVDDEKNIIEMLSYNLEREGYRVLSARDGKDALEHAKKNPDLVLLDVMMPEMNGWEVCFLFREKDKLWAVMWK